MARDLRKVTSVKIYWDGDEKPTVFNFANPIDWGWDPSIGFDRTSWSFYAGRKGHHINLAKSRHVEVTYATVPKDGAGEI